VVSILIADDHAVVRLGLRLLLEAESDFAVVGEVADGLEALLQVERLRPDVLILDLVMPGLNGVEVIRQVRKRAPKTRVVVLSMHANEAYVVEALRKGASAYVLKGSAGGEVLDAVRAALNGKQFLSPPLSGRAINAYMEKAKISAVDIYDTLTRREREVLQLGAQGRTNAEIAQRLRVSRRTVEAHRGKAFQKLGLRNQTDLVRYALRRGIVRIEE
jgi:two-component system, NarL family, response regulator NreC